MTPFLQKKKVEESNLIDSLLEFIKCINRIQSLELRMEHTIHVRWLIFKKTLMVGKLEQF